MKKTKVAAQPLERSDDGCAHIGQASLLKADLKVALFVSTKCPGGLILKSYDFSRSLKTRSIVAVGGFHTPIEQDCRDIFISADSPLIVCPARRLKPIRLPRTWQRALAQGSMLLLSPFHEDQKRTTADLALERNRFVCSIAHEVLIAYAHPGSKTETLCHEVLTCGKRVYTFSDPANQHLIEMGAIPIEPDYFRQEAHG